MKNQYFGDTRDLFKYDLVLEILLQTPLNHFVFIPMLTPNEPSSEGQRVNYERAKAGILRKPLVEFLRKCVRENKRNITELRKFFMNLNFIRKEIKLTIYRENEFFSHSARKEYFENIPNNLLHNSVILLDPDVGLEVKSAKYKMDKYIKYSEVRELFYRMDKSSILIVFQYIPRVKRKLFFSSICKKLKRCVPDAYLCLISDNQVAFFIVAKDYNLFKLIKEKLCKYSKTYNKLIVKLCEESKEI